MFAARGIAVSLSVFVLVYCVLSLAVCLCWRRLWLQSQRHSARQIADLLFTLRMFPLATAALITAAFTVPSFLLLEPRAIDEPIGGIPLTLGIAGVALGIFGIVNAGVALRRTFRTVATWETESQPVDVDGCSPVPVLRISQAVPAMTTAGIVRPRVLMSCVAEFLLTGNELQTALNHELAHVRRHDNLKKLLLRFVSFPGMASLEAAWLEAIEMAADDAAVASAGQALDLAAALIKLSRLGPADARADLSAALVHSPASAMNARVARLIAWSEQPDQRDQRLLAPERLSPWYGVGAVLATLAVFAGTYSPSIDRVTLEAGQDVAKTGDPVQSARNFVDQITTPIFPWTTLTIVLTLGVAAAAVITRVLQVRGKRAAASAAPLKPETEPADPSNISS